MDLCLINHVHPLCSHLRQLCHFSSLATRHLLKERLVTGSAQLNVQDQCTCVTAMLCDSLAFCSNEKCKEIIETFVVYLCISSNELYLE